MVDMIGNFVYFHSRHISYNVVTVKQDIILNHVVVNVIINYFPYTLQGIYSQLPFSKRAVPPDLDGIRYTGMHETVV